MYSCAGICYLKKNGYGMAITIRLSEPLLKLRSRKNLVETLLVSWGSVGVDFVFFKKKKNVFLAYSTR